MDFDASKIPPEVKKALGGRENVSQIIEILLTLNMLTSVIKALGLEPNSNTAAALRLLARSIEDTRHWAEQKVAEKGYDNVTLGDIDTAAKKGASIETILEHLDFILADQK